MRERVNYEAVWAELFSKDFFVNEKEIQEKMNEKPFHGWRQLYQFFHLEPLAIRLHFSPTTFGHDTSLDQKVIVRNLSKHKFVMKSRNCFVSCMHHDYFRGGNLQFSDISIEGGSCAEALPSPQKYKYAAIGNCLCSPTGRAGFKGECEADLQAIVYLKSKHKEFGKSNVVTVKLIEYCW
eukprot:Phypoly_transcript_17145.p1 GENE.Phypoly_transcript_17145~~Phypoly_transcript_17145.p1  ORF type:complete len:204 (+),score=15.87 Phypoly_transcript_17145:75-614(+)